MAKIPFRRKKKPLTARQIKRKELTNAAFRWIMIFMGAMTILYIIFIVISGSGLFIPKSTNAILDSVNQPTRYSWSSESVREVNLGGTELQQDAARGVMLNSEANKFQAELVGILASRAVISSDETITMMLEEDNLAEGWQRITDTCNGQMAIPVSTLEMPSKDDFKAASPELVTDQGTIFGKQAWEIEFQATPEIITKLLWLPFFDQAFKNDPDSMQWVISKSERDKITAGEFTTESGTIWVSRDNRLIEQIDTTIQINEGSKYRFMAQQVHGAAEDAVDEIELGDVESVCGGTTGATGTTGE